MEEANGCGRRLVSLEPMDGALRALFLRTDGGSVQVRRLGPAVSGKSGGAGSQVRAAGLVLSPNRGGGATGAGLLQGAEAQPRYWPRTRRRGI